MPRRTRSKHTSRPLVGRFLERISSALFSEYPKELTSLIGTQHGVYALYKKDHLYYVGKATNLRTRIKNHLRDRLAGRWDRFSLYLIHRAEHVKELESLLLRIASPDGNRVAGGLTRASNMRNELKARVGRAKKREIDDLFGRCDTTQAGSVKSKTRRALTSGQKAWATRCKNKVASGRMPGTRPLAAHAGKGFVVRGTFKGTTYRAVVLRSGRIRYNRSLYDSPSAAAVAATGKPTFNGWWFWHRLVNGEWVRLRELREKG
jgi:hypothetical protein